MSCLYVWLWIWLWNFLRSWHFTFHDQSPTCVNMCCHNSGLLNLQTYGDASWKTQFQTPNRSVLSVGINMWSRPNSCRIDQISAIRCGATQGSIPLLVTWGEKMRHMTKFMMTFNFEVLYYTKTHMSSVEVWTQLHRTSWSIYVARGRYISPGIHRRSVGQILPAEHSFWPLPTSKYTHRATIDPKTPIFELFCL